VKKVKKIPSSPFFGDRANKCTETHMQSKHVLIFRFFKFAITSYNANEDSLIIISAIST
jgi:hypothetical protein